MKNIFFLKENEELANIQRCNIESFLWEAQLIILNILLLKLAKKYSGYCCYYTEKAQRGICTSTSKSLYDAKCGWQVYQKI